MAYLSKTQVADIISKAPAGTSPGGVVAALRQHGNTLEGYDDAAAAAAPTAKKSLGERIAGFFGMEKLGQGVGQTIANATEDTTSPSSAEAISTRNNDLENNILDRIKESKRAGKDTSRLEQALSQLTDTQRQAADETTQARTGGLTTRDILGSAAHTAINIASAGSYGAAAEGAESGSLLTKAAPDIVGGAGKGKGIIRGAISGAKSAFVPGALTGGASAAASDISSNKDLSAGDVTRDVIGGTIGGGLFSSLIGTAEGGVSGYLRNKSAVTNSLKESLTTNPELVAKYSMDDAGKIIKDKNAVKLIKQGLPEEYVAVAKNASDVDKSKFKQMLAVAESGSQDARQVERASDVPGETFLRRLKHLKVTTQTAGKEIDTAATGLKGKVINGGKQLLADFQHELGNSGVNVNEKGELDFKGSDFEDLGDVESAVKRVYKRLKTAGDDAYGIHRAKRYIDEVVDYGNSEGGLRGSAKNLLKAVRHKADTLLDGQFPSYDKANTKFRDSVTALDEAGSLMGSRFNLKDIDSEFSKMKAGSVMRRILGNGANRADLLQTIKKVEGTAQKYGFRGKEDIVSQVVFSDLLENIFGTQATTGLQGQVSRAIEGVGGRLANGDLKGAAGAAIGRVLQHVNGVSKEARIEALKKLIGG